MGIRRVLGVLAALAAIIPAIVVSAASSAGYLGTFFKANRDTDTTKKLKAFQSALDELTSPKPGG